MDPACILKNIVLQIAKIKEEAFRRKEILEKVGKWLVAYDEEFWLEEYNRVGHSFMLLFISYLASIFLPC